MPSSKLHAEGLSCGSATSVSLARAGAYVVFRSAVLALDVRLKLSDLDAPLSAPTDLDRSQVTAPDQRVRLALRDCESFGDLSESQESWCCHERDSLLGLRVGVAIWYAMSELVPTTPYGQVLVLWCQRRPARVHCPRLAMTRSAHSRGTQAEREA